MPAGRTVLAAASLVDAFQTVLPENALYSDVKAANARAAQSPALVQNGVARSDR